MASPPGMVDDPNLGETSTAGGIPLDLGAGAPPELVLDSSLLAQLAPAKVVEPCPRCGASMPDEPMPWCRACGFYPKLGTQFEPDEAAEPAAPHLQRIPQWAYVLAGGLAVMLVGSLLVRFTTHPSSDLRFYWAIGQICFGITAFAAAHILAFVFASAEDASVGLLDPVLKPIAIWRPSLHALPKSFRRVATATWGIGAAICALFIGGIPWDRLTDWGDPAPRAKTNLVHAITDKARMEGDADSLEDAVQDFAGKAGDVKPEEQKPEDPKKRSHYAECVIVGFIPSEHDATDFVSLVVAAQVKGTLRIAGQVREGIAPEVRQEIRVQLAALKRERPFIPSRMEAVWLQPKLFCRVGYNDYNGAQKMRDPIFDGMLSVPSVK